MEAQNKIDLSKAEEIEIENEKDNLFRIILENGVYY
jgi:hypothetical protein